MPSSGRSSRALTTRGAGATPPKRRARGAAPCQRAGDASSAIVTPPALRARRCAPDEQRHRVAPLDRSARSRIHVGPGKPAQRRRRHVGEIEDDEPEAAGLENQGKRFQRAASRRRSVAHPQHAREIEPVAPRPRRDRTCRTHRRARPLRRAPPPPPSPAPHRRAAAGRRRPTISDRWPRRSPPPSAASSAAHPGGREPLGRRAEPSGRVRQRDVQLAGAEEGFEGGAHFRFFFAFRREYMLRQPRIKRDRNC